MSSLRILLPYPARRSLLICAVQAMMLVLQVRNLSGSAKVLGEDDFQAMAKVQPCYVAGNK